MVRLNDLLQWASHFNLSLLALACGFCLLSSHAVALFLGITKRQRGLSRLCVFVISCLIFGIDGWGTYFIVLPAVVPEPIVSFSFPAALKTTLILSALAVPPFLPLLRPKPSLGLRLISACMLCIVIYLAYWINFSATWGLAPFQMAVLSSLSIILGFFFTFFRRGHTRLSVWLGLFLGAFVCLFRFYIESRNNFHLKSPNDQTLLLTIVAVGLLLFAALLIGVVLETGQTEKLAYAKKLKYLARHDDLTGQLNSLGLREVLAQLVEFPGRDVMLVRVGLRRVAQVTDLFGQEVTDELFRQVSQRLSSQLRGGDILSKPSGNEFLVLRAQKQLKDGAVDFAKQLVTTVSEPFLIEGITVQLGAAAGISCRKIAVGETESLLNETSIALQHAKMLDSGNACLFTPEMSLALLRHHQLEQALQGALQNRQISVLFQPLFDCSPIRLTGFEALARWYHPVYGCVLPSEFIPIAEASGMISALGQYVLSEACRVAVNLPADLRVAVNLSPLQLNDPTLPEKIGETLKSYRLNPHRLELELTEGAIIGQNGQIQSCLASLKALGVGLAIDDFGTGYSSLNYLHRFSFERLKIDKSFISAITSSADARIVTSAIISLGASLGISVLAEGVETKAQLDILGQAGCRQVQGYLLGRPMPESEIGALLRA